MLNLPLLGIKRRVGSFRPWSESIGKKSLLKFSVKNNRQMLLLFFFPLVCFLNSLSKPSKCLFTFNRCYNFCQPTEHYYLYSIGGIFFNLLKLWNERTVWFLFNNEVDVICYLASTLPWIYAYWFCMWIVLLHNSKITGLYDSSFDKYKFFFSFKCFSFSFFFF